MASVRFGSSSFMAMFDGGTEQVGEDQHSVADIDLISHVACLRQAKGIILRGNAQLRDLRRALVEHMAGITAAGIRPGCRE